LDGAQPARARRRRGAWGRRRARLHGRAGAPGAGRRPPGAAGVALPAGGGALALAAPAARRALLPARRAPDAGDAPARPLMERMPTPVRIGLCGSQVRRSQVDEPSEGRPAWRSATTITSPDLQTL